MRIAAVTTDAAIRDTSAVMRQLRPAIPEDAYLSTMRRMMATDGYRLAAVYDDDNAVRAVAGYRFMEMLYCGRILYVDDLNTDAESRSRGCGALLLDWLKNEARQQGCRELHLDSGVHREAAHRFYFRERMAISAYHFRVAL